MIKEHYPKKAKKIRKFTRLGIMLWISFMVFALAPMILISVISYNHAHRSLEAEIKKDLENTSRLKTQEISGYFNNMLAQFRVQSETEVNAKLLEELGNAHKVSGKPLVAFVKSISYALIADGLDKDLKKYRNSFHYYDLFLIDINGNIVYTVAKETDLGTNLFAGGHSGSKFSAACKRTLETGNISFSDYEQYDHSGDIVSGFITAPVINENGDLIGITAIQFPIDPITRIMREGFTLGKTAEVYLVGQDLTLRSEISHDEHHKESKLIKDKILTEQTRKFKHQIDDGIKVGEMVEQTSVYKGHHDEMVLGIHTDFKIENVIFGLIAEIDEAEAFAPVFKLRRLMFLLVFLTGPVANCFVIVIVRRILSPVFRLSSATKRVEDGDYSQFVKVKTKNEIGDLSRSFNTMVAALKKNQEENILKEWFQDGQMELNAVMRSNLDLEELSRNIITFMAEYLDADIGAIYTVNTDNRLGLTGSYAFSGHKHPLNEFDFGQGLVGQAALEKKRIMLTSVPDDYIVIESGLGKTGPDIIVIKPVVCNDKVVGVIELGALNSFSENAIEFLDRNEENIAVSIQTMLAHTLVQDLLKKSQVQGEELASQHEELQQTNEEMGIQSAELEKQTTLLENQKGDLNKQNIALAKAKKEVEQKARDLNIVSRYKSEFLANMSHELRTPLNSILLLSKHLSDNKDDNLTEKQVECASTVYCSGSELLNLINEVLDLAKVESGKMTFDLQKIDLKEIAGTMERTFALLAKEKKVGFDIHIAKGTPETILTDSQRLAQILKNLLSNAFKFTENGSVTLEICYRDSLLPVTFMVKDTGPGISKDQQETVFQAFKQADGSTSRKYGGTGLGLSISRELAHLLGGTLEVLSTPGKGCVFTLSLPETIIVKKDSDYAKQAALSHEPITPLLPAVITTESPFVPEEAPFVCEYVTDDRKTVTKECYSILIIDDDPKFAKIVRDAARERGFKVLVAESGETGLHLTDCYSPNGIILDMKLPGMNGEAVLLRLKENLATRHIPVHIISTSDRTCEPMQMGAVGYLTKPVTMETMAGAFSRIETVISKKVKKVLVVQGNEVTQKQIMDLIGNGAVMPVCASTWKEAKTLLAEDDFDCIILDLALPDMSGRDLLVELKKEEKFNIPIIIHTAKDLTIKESAMLADFSESIVIKNAKSPEKLLDDTCLFLHRVETDLPKMKKEMVRRLHNRESILENKKILVVDDDMRNVFSLMNVLEDKGIKIVAAGNGKEALLRLNENTDTDLVLMDIMMPVMDGYTAIHEIRKMDTRIGKLPIIAFTAKAMRGDRSKCIAAGASDYLSKPVDADKLFSMLRVWLY